MMLLDDFIDRQQAYGGQPERVAQLIRRSPRFVLDRAALKTISDLIGVQGGASVERAAERLFMPSPNMWIEWESDVERVGHYLSATDEDGCQGYIVAVTQPLRMQYHTAIAEGRFDLARSRRGVAFDPTRLTVDGQPGRFDLPMRSRGYDMGNVLRAALMLINSPKVVHQHEATRRRENRGRARRSEVPLLTFHRVMIDLAASEVHAQSKEGREDGAKKPMHHVRAHLRFKQGRIELVRSHWRGDPAMGIKRPHYAITARPA